MHFSWILRLIKLTFILISLFLLSSAHPTSFSLTKGTANHEFKLNAPSHPIHNLPALPETQPISKRSNPNGVSYNSWGNGWTSRSNTYFALVPVLPAAAKLTLFYGRLHLLSSSFPPSLSASSPALLNRVPGQLVRFQYGGLEMRFFSMTTSIPWSFVSTVTARLRANAALGFTGLHGTVFVHEAAGLAVFVTLTAAGVPVPVQVPRQGAGPS